MGEPLRRADGRYLSRLCPDPNCGGEIVAFQEEAWRGGPTKLIGRCLGLTYESDDGPLIACAVEFDLSATQSSPHG